MCCAYGKTPATPAVSRSLRVIAEAITIDQIYSGYTGKLRDSSVVHSSGSACYINYKIEMCFGSQYPCDV